MSLWKKIVAGISSATARDIILDSGTHSLIYLDYPHHQIHVGEFFNANGVFTGLASGSAGSEDILMVAPNTTKWAHVFARFSTNKLCTFQFWDNPGVHITGTEVSVFQRNRNRGTGSTTKIYNPNVSATNTNPGGIILLWEERIGNVGGGAQINVGGVARTENEWILRQNVDFMFRIIPGTANVTVNWSLDWYENANRD